MVKRVAAIYDLHGNAEALRAVLEAIELAEVDAIVMGGDIIPGPQPNECWEMLRALSTPLFCIRGNGERETAAFAAGGDLLHLPLHVQRLIDWSREQISAAMLADMANWPATLSRSVGKIGSVLFCHATPRSDTELFTEKTPAEQLVPIMCVRHERLIICGHTHMQFDRVVGDVRIVNVGSVGMPFGMTRACWLLIDGENSASPVQLRQTEYDTEFAAEAIRRTSFPGSEEYVNRFVLNTPDRATMVQLYESKALDAGNG